MTTEEMIREFIDGNRQPVSLDEVTTLPATGAKPPPRRWGVVLAVAAAVSLVVGAATVWAVRRDDPNRSISVIDTVTPTTATPPTSTVEVAPSTTVTATATNPMTPEQFGEIVASAANAAYSGSMPPWALQASDVRTAANGSPSLFASLTSDRGRLFVESVEGGLDLNANPPYPGEFVAFTPSDAPWPAWVWPLDDENNTVAVTTEQRTIVVRTEASDPTIGIVGSPAEVYRSLLTMWAMTVAYVLDGQMNDTLGIPTTLVTLPPVDDFKIVPIAELDAPGEQARFDETTATLSAGPITDTAGRTYGIRDMNGDFTSPNVDFEPRLGGGAANVIIGFISTQMIPGASNSGYTFVYGVTGDVIGYFHRVDLLDANGVTIGNDDAFTELPSSGALSLADAPELVAFDLDGDQTLSRDELHATAGGMRRIIGNGVQGNVYATDLETFLQTMAGVEDPTTGAASLIVPFFDLDLQPAGTVDLGANDTIIFDEAGQPIGGWAD